MDIFSKLGRCVRNDIELITETTLKRTIADRVEAEVLPITLRKILLYQDKDTNLLRASILEKDNSEDNILDFVSKMDEAKTIPLTLRKFVLYQKLKTG